MGKEGELSQNGHFGAIIRKSWEDSGLSKKKFIDKLRISPSCLRGLENGSKPRQNTFVIVVQSLGISREEASKFASSFGYKELADIYAAPLPNASLDPSEH